MTEVGEIFVRDALAEVAKLKAAPLRTREAVAGITGRLTIGYTNFAAHGPMGELVESFRLRHPKIDVMPRG